MGGMKFLLVSMLLISSVALAQTPATQPATPEKLDGAEPYVYRAGEPQPMRLHVFKPVDWKNSDRRPALIHFFGGGWVRGTPDKAAYWARTAAKWGMVGVAPDYRTQERFGTTPMDAVADARAAVRWVQDHADELGIDPARVVVSGNSAGGHLALWTGIEHAPFGSSADESPTCKPTALILFSAVSDCTQGIGAKRCGEHAKEISPVYQLDAHMPPIIMFHGDADKTVPHDQAVALDAALKQSGNSCEFVTVPGGGHNFGGDLPEWKDRSREMVRAFLVNQKLLDAGK
ncbi:N/A [soil metagenome]